jgi:hypothetical protein
MKVGHWQQARLSFLTPTLLGGRLTFGTVAIAATVVHVSFVSATSAPLAVPTKDCGPAVDDLLEHLAVSGWWIVHAQKRRPKLPTDVSQFQLPRSFRNICFRSRKLTCTADHDDF